MPLHAIIIVQDHISRYPKAVALSCKATVGSKFSSSWAESTPISLHPQNSVAVALAPPANIAARCIILLMHLLLELVFIPLSLIPLSLTVSVITKMTAPASAQDASNMIKVCSLEAIEHLRLLSFISIDLGMVTALH